MIIDYQNYDELIQKSENRAHRIREKDRVLYIRNNVPTSFGRSPNDLVEFALYDMSDNLLAWRCQDPPNVLFTAGSAQKEGALPEALVDPKKDIEASNYDRGTFRVSYQFLKERVGSFRTNDKVFIKDISPSRTEARILPVFVGDYEVDSRMKKRFQHFKHNDQEKYDILDIVGMAINEITLQMIEDEFESLFLEHFQYDYLVSEEQLEHIFLGIRDDILTSMKVKLKMEDDEFISYRKMKNLFLMTLTEVVDNYIPRMHEG